MQEKMTIILIFNYFIMIILRSQEGLALLQWIMR